ncbi:nucleophile aminohydrolase [Blastocladiella britannica]|nr:nucleophile aminohydrolase [Blastocladiella britannica]
MEALFGIVGKDFVIVASDTSSIRSIVVMKSDEDRSRNLNKHNVLLYTGEPGDSVQFVEYIQRNAELYSIRNDVGLSTLGCASFTRRALADALRSRNSYQTNLLIGGYDPKDGPRLYWIDYLSSSLSVPFACQGYAGYFCYSTMDRYYHKDMSKEEAMALVKKCIAELKTRFVANLPNWQVKIIDQNGIEQILVSAADV